MKRFRTSLILFFTLILVALYAYFVEYKGKEKKDKLKAFNEQVLSVNKNEINKLTILNNDEEIVFDKIDNKWEIVSPLSWRADDSIINELTGEIVKTSSLVVKNPDEQDFDKYGINQNLKLKVKLTNSKVYEIVFGDKSPITEEKYVYSLGKEKKIVLAKKELFSKFISDISSFRDKSIFNNLKISKLNFAKYSFLKDKDKKDKWIEKNNLINLDSEEISSMLESIKNLKAKEFLINKDLNKNELRKKWKKYGLKKSKLSFLNDKGNKYLLYYSNKAGENYFAYELESESNSKLSQVFKLENLDVFNKTIFDLRKKDIFNFDNTMVTSIELIDKNKFTVLSKTNDTWSSIENKNIDNVKVNSFLSKVNSIKVKEFLNKNKYRKSSFDKSLILKNKDEIILKIDFGKVDNDKVLIKYNDKYYYIDTDILDKFDIKEFLLD